MAFEEKLPEWKAAGIEPPASKREEGWKASERPSAEYWNWQMSRTYKALKEIHEKAAEKTDVTQAAKDAKDYTDQKVKDIDLSKITPDSIGAAKKADLDTLQKNSVSIKTSTSKDFNTYREPGLYFIGSVSEYANAPSSDGSFSWGILRVEALGTTAYVVQSYTCVLNNFTFTRSKAEDSTGRGWELWRAASKLDSDGVLRLSKWLDIRSDGPAANLIGSTHVYQQFLLGDQRKGYVGAGDPKAPNNIALVSDHGDTLVNAKTNIWLNAAGGAIHLNGRNILWEFDQLKQSGVNAKQGTVDVLNSKSVAASINDPWPTLNSKIGTLHGRRDDRFAVEGSSGMNGTSTWLYTSLGTIPAGATQVLFNTRPTDDWNGTYVIFPQNGGWSSQAKLQLIDKNGKIATIAELSGSNYAITRVVIQSLIYGPTDGSLYSNIGYFSNGSKSGFGTGLRNVGTLDNSGVIQIRLDVFNPDRLVEYKLDMDQISYL